VKYAFEAFGGVILKNSRIKPFPATPRKQKAPNDMAWDRSRVSVVTGWLATNPSEPRQGNHSQFQALNFPLPQSLSSDAP